MNFRSHTEEEIKQAIIDGNQAWEFSTEIGEDDVLIGSRDEVEADLYYRYEGQDYPEIPGELRKIDPSELGIDLAWEEIIRDPDYVE